MGTFKNIGELRKILRDSHASWQVATKYRDEDAIPKFGLGGSPKGLAPADEKAKRIEFKKLFKEPINNPLLMKRWLELGYVKKSKEFEGLIASPAEAPVGILDIIEAPEPPSGGLATRVDWRHRWGWPWITSIRDQNGCNACWAFASTALMEAMTRIEHAVWTTRSEGDVHKGVGKVCASLGNMGEVFTFISSNNGQCDPDCFPWTTADIAYAPCADRNGRTVKIGTTTNIGSVNDQKTWIDTIGPIGTYFMVASDFFGYGGGVYRRASGATDAGGHFMLIVGYDDSQGCWIVKNSWGAWGESGYCRIAYGESQIDSFAKLGLRGTNPDPLTKRRLHNGNLIESGNGSLHRNFEMLATRGGLQIQHWWREGTSPFPWSKASRFSKDAAHCPTLTATTYNRNFEAVYLTTRNRLHHWWFSQTTKKWNDGGVFGPKDVAGVPGFIQGNYHSPANFEVVVRTCDGRLAHLWRENGPPWRWHNGGRFASDVAHSGATLVEGREGPNGNLEVVCVLADGRMQHWWRDDEHGFTWKLRTTFGACVSSPPVMIEGQYGAADERAMGNYELCVAVRGRVQHWWRFNNGDRRWRRSKTFGSNVKKVVGMVEGSFGFNLEIIVLRWDRKLQHYWRDGAGWHAGAKIGTA